MNINVPYNVGFTFWVPRVRYAYIDEKVDIDGKIFIHTNKKLEAYTKQKIVNGIEVIVRKDVSIRYLICDVGDDVDYLFENRYYIKELDASYSYEPDALNFAVEWAAENGTEYFGPK